MLGQNIAQSEDFRMSIHQYGHWTRYQDEILTPHLKLCDIAVPGPHTTPPARLHKQESAQLRHSSQARPDRTPECYPALKGSVRRWLRYSSDYNDLILMHEC